MHTLHFVKDFLAKKQANTQKHLLAFKVKVYS